MQGQQAETIIAVTAGVLADSGYSQREIARRLGLSRTGVQQILKRAKLEDGYPEAPVVNQLRPLVKSHLQARALDLADRCLDQVEGKLDKTSAYQAAGIYGLLRTHERVDAGEATEHIAVLHHHEIQDQDNLLGRLAAALETSKSPASEPKKVNDDGEL